MSQRKPQEQANSGCDRKHNVIKAAEVVRKSGRRWHRYNCAI